MSPLAPVLHTVRTIRAWPVSAQQHARRNAMIALTECTQRRAEREDVERFLSARSTDPTVTRDSAISLHA
ncbi:MULTISPECIES: hypothetical protein [Nocardioides]|uniref:Uncharacterized protein n=1 Tax=Nocardioides vastitatis TaxID=2568655 RepID=A0ABW0ZLZ6_9ACTN|nr:hypothetical protein [Nocardioides sp.]THI99996.1 hypothetical protein E7Z54_12180 [Nocardioides sp.]